MSRTTRFFSLLILAGLIAIPAYPSVTTYTDLASWQAATSSNYQTVTFEGLTPADTSTYFNTASGVTADGVQFSGYTSSGNPSVQVIDTNVSTWYNFGTNDALMQDMNRPNSGSALPYIQIVLPAGVNSVSFDLFSVSPNGLPVQITVNGVNYTVPTNSCPNTAFWGITSTTPITSITITLLGTTYNGSTHLLLDNFRFGSMEDTAAPEASTYVLIGSGLVGLVLFKRRLAV